MKVGLFSLSMPATLGGGYVLREDVERFATAVRGRHQFELVRIPPADPPPPPPPLPPPKSWSRARWDWLVMTPEPGPPPPPPPRSALRRFADEVRARRFDLLWFNHIVPLHVDVPYVLNIFDMQHRLQPWFPEVSNNGQWEHREEVWSDGVQRAAMVVVGSEEARDQLCHFYRVAADNVQVLPFPTPQGAVDIAEGRTTAPARTDVRAKYGIQHDFLFYPAQLWPHKNHVNLFLALKLLRERGREIALVLTGADHGNSAYLQETARALGLGDLIHFCGFVPYEDVLTLYRETRALSYVSYFGPENLPPLEAMALECPVILSDIPGVRTLHGDGPVYVDPRDPAQIASGIAVILDHPEQLPARLRAGKETALANNYAAYLERFQRLLDGFEPYRRAWPQISFG